MPKPIFTYCRACNNPIRDGDGFGSFKGAPLASYALCMACANDPVIASDWAKKIEAELAALRAESVLNIQESA